MRIYTVHERPVPVGADPDVVLVKEGFSWPALVAAPVWLLWHRQWLGLAVYLAGALLVALLAAVMDVAGGVLVGLGYAVLAAASANDWRRFRLAARGYRLRQVVAAASPAEAEGRYFHERADLEPEAPMRPAAALPPFRRRQSATPLAPWSP